ncbi:homoserine O-succinyltransferase [Enterococcus sp. PF1-24]|uniref:homoserine O-succinyltransferase n=1 Tax=unclassified Enterococcus TaxID=2608891 RepID=UPI002473B615|nr:MULTISPECIES: homoserine O-succinyltransferase [unclassified Enterococcus]MDH6365109.1 homoserine O-succinyltransferase [Enterococcus sp. PFB1-1]MDH6402210.1 homoserine O-succinyltransferase [Enterococcus sp. PF1-24]
MPIKLLEDFPAKKVIEAENIFAIDNQRAEQQDIRPLKMLILNLMPNKLDTEIQLLRLISQSPLQIDVDFLKITSHNHKNTSIHHLAKFYLEFAEVKDLYYDGLIITGAPVEQLAFEEVDYWQELQAIMDWSQTNVYSTVHICWGAQAALYHHYGVEKTAYSEKLFGVFPQQKNSEDRLLRGFDDVFACPQSRYTGLVMETVDLERLTVTAQAEIGATMLISKDRHDIFLLGHWEYDTDSLKKEYFRDAEKGLATALPKNYFVNDDPEGKIINNWRAHANLFYHNWLNDVYQGTPFELTEILAINQSRLKK